MLNFQTLPKLRIFKETVGVENTVRFNDSKKTNGGTSYTYTFKPYNIYAIPSHNKRLRDGHR